MNNAIRKHVLMLLTNAFDPDPRVYQEAKSLVNDGYEVRIVCWDREYKKLPFEEIDGIGVERIYIRSTHRRGTSQLFFLLLFWVKAFFRIITREFDVVHCHDFDTLPLGLLLAKLRKKKVIFDAHESYSDMLGSNVSVILKKGVSFVEKILIRHVDLLITVGEILEKEYQRRGAKKTCVVGNWKSIDDFQISKEMITVEKKRLNIPDDKLIVSFMGFFNRDRKILPLIEAASANNQVFLILAGTGELQKQIIEKTKDCKNILFLGNFTMADIPLYTSISDVIYYGLDRDNPNSKYSTPNKLFEALVAGRALITGNCGEIGRIVKEENCGIAIDEDITSTKLNEAFDLLRYDGALHNYKMNALAAAERKYNWGNAEGTLLQGYSQVIYGIEERKSQAMERVNCVICDIDNTKRLLIKDSFNIVMCKNCGLIYVNPRLTKKELINFYLCKSNKNTSYEDIDGEKKHIQKFKNRLKLIEKFFDTPGKILDIGCSTGLFLKMARDVGWEVYGNDIDENKIRYARNRYGLNVRCGELIDLRFPGKCFDVVTLFDSIEHLTDPLSILKEISRLLKKNGILVITTPNSAGLLPKLTYFLFAKTIGAWEHPTPPGHIYQFSQETIKKLLQKAHFKPVNFVSEQIDIQYSAGKLENAIIQSLKERKLHADGNEDKSSHNTGGSLIYRKAKKMPRKIIGWVCLVIVGVITVFAKLSKKGDSVLVVAERAN